MHHAHAVPHAMPTGSMYAHAFEYVSMHAKGLQFWKPSPSIASLKAIGGWLISVVPCSLLRAQIARWVLYFLEFNLRGLGSGGRGYPSLLGRGPLIFTSDNWPTLDATRVQAISGPISALELGLQRLKLRSLDLAAHHTKAFRLGLPWSPGPSSLHLKGKATHERKLNKYNGEDHTLVHTVQSPKGSKRCPCPFAR